MFKNAPCRSGVASLGFAKKGRTQEAGSAIGKVNSGSIDQSKSPMCACGIGIECASAVGAPQVYLTLSAQPTRRGGRAARRPCSGWPEV